MEKSKLKSGMMLGFANSSNIKLVLLNTNDGDTTCDLEPKEFSSGGFRHYNYYKLDSWDENLEALHSTSLGNITKVWDMYGILIWERKITI